jgi:hypothetical protein
MSASSAVRLYLLCLAAFAEFTKVIAINVGIENQNAPATLRKGSGALDELHGHGSKTGWALIVE